MGDGQSRDRGPFFGGGKPRPKPTLQTLIADLEAAEVGSRALSDRVLLALGWRWETKHYEMDMVSLERTSLIDNQGVAFAQSPANDRPNPTMSVDDALALVDREKYNYRITAIDSFTVEIHSKEIELNYVFEEGIATTPALALSIAILKERQSHEGT